MGDNERKMLSNKKLKDSLRMLRAIQDELRKIDQDEDSEKVKITMNRLGRAMSFYPRREEAICAFPNFWLIAFLSHPTLGNKLTEEDQKIFKHLGSLHVEEVLSEGHICGYRILFRFKDNPYFDNRFLSKTCTLVDDNSAVGLCEQINWKEGMKPLEAGGGNESFFNWFSKQSGDSDEVSRIIIGEVWPFPLRNLNYELLTAAWRDKKIADEAAARIEARVNSGREAGPSPHCEAWLSSSSRGGPSSRSKGRGRR